MTGTGRERKKDRLDSTQPIPRKKPVVPTRPTREKFTLEEAYDLVKRRPSDR
jgi:hypothetical protein